MKRMPQAGVQAWETFLRRGKIEEGLGRLRAAEQAYRKALTANPDSNPLEREFARFLENRGRFKEAEASLLRAMRLGWPREEGEATLTRLREQSDISPTSDWPQVFSALLCERKYRAGFRLGDAMLKKSSRLSNANIFLWPWWHKVSSRLSDEKLEFCAQELKRLQKAGAGGKFAGWFAYCRGVLFLCLGQVAEAMAEYEGVKRLRSPRYSLLHHPFVLHRLLAGDFKWTIANCRDLLKHVPDYWWFQCRMAEAFMAKGDLKRGLREFERAAARAADAWSRQSIVTWHSAALLWAGEYRRALEKLDHAAGLGTKIWVDCWRGAAYLKLGRLQKALADLDAAIKTDPQDLEAHLWRGEAHRLLGRPTEALRDLDRAISLDDKYMWGYFNRALVRDSSGDSLGMAADFAMIPKNVVAAIRGCSPEEIGVLGPKEMRKVLEEGLKRAKGIRRPENYLNSIWLPSRPGTGRRIKPFG
ncbi:MAG: tetratricopeptide repeat protein [Elusimicrobia bacterium]|nr:tetratricopeptide repeat protein [Elusimicrobiota bacterium]